MSEPDKGCQCSCHTMPDHSRLQDFADANQYHIRELVKLRVQRDQLLMDLECLMDFAFRNDLENASVGYTIRLDSQYRDTLIKRIQEYRAE